MCFSEKVENMSSLYFSTISVSSHGLFSITSLLVWLLVLSYSSRSVSASDKTATSKQPHIVFVLADDYGYNDIGYHGKQIKTPKLDEIAASGIKLENYYVQPICSPTRSQLLSGRYQIHTGLQHSIINNDQANGIPLDIPLLPEKLKEVGYSTHMMGKWHVGFYKKEYMPQYRGFHTFYGFLGGHDTYYNHMIPYKGIQYLDWRDEKGPIKNESHLYSAQLLTNRAINIIQSHQQADKPLFIYLAYQSVHSPLQVPEHYEKPYVDTIKDLKRRKYAGMVAAMDEGVGNLTKVLKSTGMWENTIFIFSTDNGGAVPYGGNNYPLRGWKGSLWEGGMHGVGFVAGGFVKPHGVINKELMHVSDWYPTLVKLAGGHLNGMKGLDGYDIWDAIVNGKPSPREVLLHNIDILYKRRGIAMKKYEEIWDTSVRAAIRVGHLKLLTGYVKNGSWVPPPGDGNEYKLPAIQDEEHHEKNLWLFNITADPNEHHDLSKEHPELVWKILKILNQFNSTQVPPRFPPGDPKANPALHGGVWGPWE